MATDINSVTVIGRLTREIQMQNFGNTSKGVISIANNRSFKKGENWETQVSYFDVVVWGQVAERLSGKLVKGDQVCITGRLTQDRWEKDGQKQSKIYINAESVQPCLSDKKIAEGTAPQNVQTVASSVGGEIQKEPDIELW